MNDSLSPYVPPRYKTKARQRQSSVSFVIPAIVLCGLNLILGMTNFRSEICEVSKWGAYCGQYILLLTWFAWGTGKLLNRLATVSLIGILWMIASWLGYWAARPDRVQVYRHEFSQIFNVVPLAFVISSLPLFFIRRQFGFKYASKGSLDSYSNDTAPLVVLGVMAMFIGFAYLTDKWLSSDVVLSFTIAIVLGSIATISSPLLSIALLGPQLKLYLLFPAFLMVPLLAGLLSRFFGLMGPGAASTVYATMESMIAATTALGSMVAAYGYWRLTGVRLLPQGTLGCQRTA